MTILVTGAAGFIGYHVCHALLERGESVIGIDNLNDYYDVALKNARLEQLDGAFAFHKIDIANREAMEPLFASQSSEISYVIHLAAQAGVRYSLENPQVYVDSNITGQRVVLECCRLLPNLKQLVYASSSSVYGGNTKLPFAVDDPTDQPVSLYAATKKGGELLADAYHHLYEIPITGLRFFTVYGPWGRPDMAYYSFTKAILEDKPISVFNHGDMARDFTYIDDIVSGVLACLEVTNREHSIYNLGNHKAVPLLEFIAELETLLGKKAEIEMKPMQPGDVKATFADIEASRRDLGFEPKTSIQTGLHQFVRWYRAYNQVG